MYISRYWPLGPNCQLPVPSPDPGVRRPLVKSWMRRFVGVREFTEEAKRRKGKQPRGGKKSKEREKYREEVKMRKAK